MRVSQCCCGCSLKTGTILIGVYYLIAYFIGVIIASIALYLVNHPEIAGSTDDAKEIKLDESELDVFKVIVGIVLAILILLSVLQILLIVGAVKENARLVYVWFVTHIIFLVLMVIGVISSAFKGMKTSNFQTGSIFPTVVNFLLTIYFLLVVYSYHGQLRNMPHPLPSGQTAAFIEGYPLPDRK